MAALALYLAMLRPVQVLVSRERRRVTPVMT